MVSELTSSAWIQLASGFSCNCQWGTTMRDQCVTRVHLTDKNTDELERRAVSRVASRAAIKTAQRLASHHEHIYMHALTFLTRKQTE